MSKHPGGACATIQRLEADCAMKDKRIEWTVADNAKKAIRIAELEAEVKELEGDLSVANLQVQAKRWSGTQ